MDTSALKTFIVEKGQDFLIIGGICMLVYFAIKGNLKKAGLTLIIGAQVYFFIGSPDTVFKGVGEIFSKLFGGNILPPMIGV